MIGSVLPRPPALLAYHGVNHVEPGEDPARLVLSPQLLESQVRWLQRRDYRFVSAEELLDERSGRAPTAGTAVLTFDDGWADALHVVTPLLGALGVRATFYVTPGRWKGQHEDVRGPAGRLLSRSEAEAVHAAGMELGSHTMSHRDLRGLDDDDLRWELEAAKAAVEDITGRRCKTFAYPFGLFDDRVESAVARAGYELALAWGPEGTWRPLAAPRLPAPPRHGAMRLGLKLHGVRPPDSVSRRAYTLLRKVR